MARSSENSIRARVLKEMLDHFTHDLSLGKMVQTGELRKRIKEPPYIKPSGYNMTHISRGNYTMELLAPANDPCFDGAILQLHGGGYVGAVRNKYYTFAKYYSELSGGYAVLTPDYRVAPENPYPAALEDAVDAFLWLLERGYKSEQIIIAGDSAGGGLSMALCMYLRDHNLGMPKAIIAMSPWTDLTASGKSYVDNYEVDPLFGNTRESMIYNNPYPGEHSLKEPYISPLFGDFNGFPPTLIQVGSLEMLLSDSVSAAEKIKASSGNVKLSVYDGMFHVFQMCFNKIPESKLAWKEIGVFLEEL